MIFTGKNQCFQSFNVSRCAFSGEDVFGAWWRLSLRLRALKLLCVVQFFLDRALDGGLAYFYMSFYRSLHFRVKSFALTNLEIRRLALVAY